MPVRRALPVAGAAVWLALVVIARRAGLDIAETPRVAVGAAPVVGRWLWSPDGRFVWPVLLGAVTVWFGPTLAERMPWRRLLVLVVVAAGAWTTSLAATEGLAQVPQPLDTRYEYLAVLPTVDDVGVGTFVSTYTERLGDYPTHVKGHPPGPTLVLTALDRVGLGGPGWAAVLVIGVGASAAAAVLIALRLLADEPTARRAASFLVLLPGAIWLGTSTDALFTGVIAWGIALTACAVTAGGRRAHGLAAAAGVVVASGLFMTYGAAPLLLVPLAVVVFRRSWNLVPAAAAGAAAVVVGFLVAGFWWFDGVEATRGFYEAGVSQRREYGYFALVGNPAAFALAVGPATAAALTILRDRRVWVLVGSALAAVLIADVSGLSKGEVERIWLPFVPWVVAATTAFEGRVDTRVWLGLQASAALVVEAWLMSPW